MVLGSTDLDSGTALLELIQNREAGERADLKQTYANLDQHSTPAIPEPKSPELDLSSTQLHQIIVDSTTSQDNTEPAPATADALDIESEPASVTTDVADLVYRPKLPDMNVNAGCVFPPVSGRIILHQLKSDGDIIIKQHDSGDWEVTIDKQWKLINRRQACFASSNEAREHFVSDAQIHQQLKSVLSEHRCLAITEELEQDYPWRVWQVVRAETSLAELLTNALKNHAPRRVAERVYIIAEKFLQAHQLIADNTPQIAYGLDNIGLNKSVMGINKSVLAFVDFVPEINAQEVLPPPMEALLQNFKQPIHETLSHSARISIPYILHHLDIYARGNEEKMKMVDVLRTLFIGEH
jgi:hypothetical protein